MNLPDLLAYASDRIPFYQDKRVRVQDIRSFPIITKQNYMDGYPRFMVPGTRNDQLQELKTSGSTGAPFIVYKQQSDYFAQLKQLWTIRYRYHNVSPLDKGVDFIFGLPAKQTPLPPQLDKNDKKLYIHINGLQEHFIKWMEAIYAFQPRYIIGYPSLLFMFAQLLQKNKMGLPSSIIYVESMGEFLSHPCREYLEQSFQIPIANYYGCTEIFGIAYSCPNHHLHIMKDNAYVEIIPKCRNESAYGVEGNIVITGLNSLNPTFIRYNLQDIGILYPGDRCGCGSDSDYIEIRRGRQYQQVKISPNKAIHSNTLFSVVELVGQQMNHCILWFRFVQQGYDRLTVFLQLKNGYSMFQPTISMAIQKQLHLIFNSNTTIEVKYLENDYDTNQHAKFQFIKTDL